MTPKIDNDFRKGSCAKLVEIDLFRKLNCKKAVWSSGGGPYRITRRGLELVRSELDNR